MCPGGKVCGILLRIQGVSWSYPKNHWTLQPWRGLNLYSRCPGPQIVKITTFEGVRILRVGNISLPVCFNCLLRILFLASICRQAMTFLALATKDKCWITTRFRSKGSPTNTQTGKPISIHFEQFCVIARTHTCGRWVNRVTEHFHTKLPVIAELHLSYKTTYHPFWPHSILYTCWEKWCKKGLHTIFILKTGPGAWVSLAWLMPATRLANGLVHLSFLRCCTQQRTKSWCNSTTLREKTSNYEQAASCSSGHDSILSFYF